MDARSPAIQTPRGQEETEFTGIFDTPEWDRFVRLLKWLNDRTFWIGMLFMGVFVVSFFYLDVLIDIILRDLLPEGTEAHPVRVIVLTPTEAIVLKLRIASTIGIAVVIPMLAWLVFQFFREELDIRIPFGWKQAFPTVGASLSLFLLGVCYAYFVMLPFLFGYLYETAADADIASTYSLEQFIFFVVKICFAAGVGFQLPVLLYYLIKYDLVRFPTLKEYRRHSYVMCFIAGAMFTPPDLISQLMVGIPLMLLYEGTLLIATVLLPQEVERQQGYRISYSTDFSDARNPQRLPLVVVLASVAMGLALYLSLSLATALLYGVDYSGLVDLYWFSAVVIGSALIFLALPAYRQVKVRRSNYASFRNARMLAYPAILLACFMLWPDLAMALRLITAGLVILAWEMGLSAVRQVSIRKLKVDWWTGTVVEPELFGEEE